MAFHIDRESLPIYSAKGALIKEFRINPCCVVVGETGSGKTTQIPQVQISLNAITK